MSISLSMPPGSGQYILIGSLPLLVLSEFRSNSYVGTFVFKMLSSVAFVSSPLPQASIHESPYCVLITTGLLLSLVGDFFLLPSQGDFFNRNSSTERKISISFQLGVVAFAAAHIAYIFAFLHDSQDVSRELFATTFVTTMVLAKWLGVIYPPAHSSISKNVLDLAIPADMKPLVFAYAAIISCMFAVAVSTVPSSTSTGWAYQRSLGAAMFVTSDIFVAKDAFCRTPAPNKRSWFRIAVGYGLYFWGQMVIAGTVKV
ncbi:YhhN-like protein [Aspergillus ambiguus]|uniref:lysoplasmalogenase n=1 Tax=Aspergillus ambiguus TaxID=176160 RepID=UPI003CCD7119